MKAKKRKVVNSSLDSPNLKGEKMGVLDDKEGTLYPSLIIPLPPLKLLPNMVYLNLATPCHSLHCHPSRHTLKVSLHQHNDLPGITCSLHLPRCLNPLAVDFSQQFFADSTENVPSIKRSLRLVPVHVRLLASQQYKISTYGIIKPHIPLS